MSLDAASNRARRRRPTRANRAGAVALYIAAGLSLTPTASADPVVVPVYEGQLGTTPGAGEDIAAASFWVFAAATTNVVHTLRVTDTVTGTTVDLQKDVLHELPAPVEIDELIASYDDVDKAAPATAPWPDSDDNLAGVFAYAQDGTLADTLGVVLGIVPSDPGLPSYVVLDNLPTIGFPDEALNKTAVSADADGDITVFFTEFSVPGPGGVPKVRAQRVNKNGILIGGFFDITHDPHSAPDAAPLDADGDAQVVATIDFADSRIKGNIVDTSALTPVVGAEFPVSGVPAFLHVRPSVAADVNTGNFTVVWEDLTGAPGNPVDLKARRFTHEGVPLGAEFTVNTTTASAQGQADLAYGPNGESAIVWAGDPLPGGDLLDIFLQVYDASGQAIGGEIQVNTVTDGVQDWPQVQFLSTTDSQGRPQFVVAWRDVADFQDNTPSGTGHSYKCFTIDDGPTDIFADGFESGDTTSWSSVTQN